MDNRGGKLPSSKYNLPRSRSPQTTSSGKTASSSSEDPVSPMIYFPTELERLRSQLDEQQEDLDTASATSDTESLSSLMEALESVHPARLSAKQRIYRDAHLQYRSRHFTPFVNHNRIQQTKRDTERSQPLRPVKKAIYRGSLPPKLYPNHKQQYQYEQLVLGVQMGPQIGNGGGQLNTFYNCPRDISSHDKQEAWKMSLRGMSNTPQTSIRKSDNSNNRGTVMGASPHPDKLSSQHMENLFNRYQVCEEMDRDSGHPPQQPQAIEANIWYEG